MILDPLYLVVLLPALLVSIYAQFRVKGTYNKYRQVVNMQGLTGRQVASILLRANRLDQVAVESTPEELSDHYDPRTKMLRLSSEVYSTPSVAALGIVAHEVGHALQDNVGYVPLKLRAGLVPVANLGSQLGPWLAILGLWIQMVGLVWLGIILFTGAVVFYLVTLPVEWDASNRARQMLRSLGLVSASEYNAASSVLSAAALTYVAALLVAIFQLLYFVMRVIGMSRSDE